MSSVQRRDEQTAGATSMDSLQPRDQVVDKRAEPDEKRAADSMVRRKSDHPDDFVVPSDDPRRLQKNGRPTTGTHVETTVSVQSSPPPFPSVSQLPRPSASPALPLRDEAEATLVRVSNAVPLPSPSGHSARCRHVKVTPTVWPCCRASN